MIRKWSDLSMDEKLEVTKKFCIGAVVFGIGYRMGIQKMKCRRNEDLVRIFKKNPEIEEIVLKRTKIK